MVGMNPTTESGEIIPIRVEQAKRAAGVTHYEAEWIELQQKMDRYGLPRLARLELTIRDIEALPKIAETLHRLGNEITALYSQPDLTPFTKLFEMFDKIRSSQRRLRTLDK